MGKREQEDCQKHRALLQRSHDRLAELEEKGIDAVSHYDITIAHGGDAAKALHMAKYLTRNHIAWFADRVADCSKIPQQITLFDALAPSPDAHLGAAYEDQQSGMDDC